MDTSRPFWKSLTKLVLLLFATTACVGLFFGYVSEDTFKTGLFMVFSFYFSNKNSNSDNQIPAK
jgi:hypothetical protein